MVNRLLLCAVLLASAAAHASAGGDFSATRPATGVLFEPGHLEAKFQLDLWLPVVGSDESNRFLYAAYQQRSLWQLDNGRRPYRVENNFRPELGGFLGAPAARRMFDSWPSALSLSLAYAHESNGLEGELSRGWNRTIGGVHWGDDEATVHWSVFGWVAYRVEETNDDLSDHAGDGELRVTLRLDRWVGGWFARPALRARSAFSTHASNERFFNNLELGLHFWPRAFPTWLFTNNHAPSAAIAIEWFVGTGESLIDYDEHRNRVRLGITLRR